MTNGINSTQGTSLQDLGLGRVEPEKDRNELGQDQFLKLMVAQLRNQDPFKPLENGDFISQMAQFSSVSGLEELQTSFADLAGSLQSNQALQASTMVGRSVLVPSDVVPFNGAQPVTGVIDLPTGSNGVNLTITDGSGQIIRQINYGTQGAGQIPFSWDGLTDSGNPVPPGNYRISAKANTSEGGYSLDTLVNASVESVTLGGGGRNITLNLTDLGSVAFSDVREIS